MSALTNPYVLKIMELNKDIEGLKLDKQCIQYDLEEYKRNPVETVSIDYINEQMQNVLNQISVCEAQIIKVSKFLRQ